MKRYKIDWQRKFLAESDTGHIVKYSDIAELQAKLEKAEKVIKLYEEYLEFLNKANEVPYSIALVHGWRVDKKDINKGKEYREKIKRGMSLCGNHGS